VDVIIDSQPYIGINPEAVRLQMPAPDGWGYYDAMPTACRYDISSNELAKGFGRYVAEDTVWTLSVQEKLDATSRIEPGWRVITTDGDKFMVLTAAFSKMLQFWKLTTRNRKIVNRLRDEVSIYRGTSATRANLEGRRPEQTPTAAYTGLVCRVQPGNRAESDVIGVHQYDNPYDIYLEEDIAIEMGDYVLVTKKPDMPTLVGRILEIREHSDIRAIDVLPHLVCDDNNARAA
jgi:hypothetical protein